MAVTMMVGQTVDLTDEVELVHAGEENTEGALVPVPAKRRLKKGKAKKVKSTKAVKLQPKEEPTEEAPPTKKRRRAESSKSAPTATRREVSSADYANMNPDDEEWYDVEEDEWHDAEWPEGEHDDNYPYPMWNLMYEDIKLEEHPELIHDTCVRLQENELVMPWQLKQAPKALLETIFPTGTHTRHLMAVLHVQEILQRRSATEMSQEGSLAKAVAKMARETSKAHKTRKEEDDETESDSDAERVQFDFSKSMGVYHLGNIPPGIRRVYKRWSRWQNGRWQDRNDGGNTWFLARLQILPLTG